MAANLFGRYVWLIDTLRKRKRLTFEEINNLWVDSGLSYGIGDDLPLRTFHNHRKAIKDIFDVYINCDVKGGYKYYIDDPQSLQGDAFRIWLIDSYATLNQLQADKSLEGRIIFENVPSGYTWLTTLTEAIRLRKTVVLTHQGFSYDYENCFEIEPYYLKIFKQRWYVIGKNLYYVDKKKKYEAEGKTYESSVFRIYALDRVLNVELTGKKFEFDEDFTLDNFLCGCVGVIPSKDPIEHVVIKSYQPKYLRTLPLHESQQEIESDEESAIFSYDVKTTYDFMQLIMQLGDQVEVLEPESLRDKMRNLAKTLTSYYKK